MKFKATFFFALLFSLQSFGQSSEPAAADNTLIAFASDTQAPMWVETLWLKKHNNKTATQVLFSDLKKRQLGSLFLLGDVVSLGSSDKQWKPIDTHIQNLRDKGVSVHAVLGNHEVMGKAKSGEQKFQSRFPNHARTGYVVVKDSVAIVLLNSNFKKLSQKENNEQVLWYKKTLEQLDADPAIHFIITGCHHSPYTNSKIVGSSTPVQEKFVPAFIQSAKSKLFLSGHCHGFERYNVEGKEFIVIGGGGGLNQPLKKGEGVLPDLAADYKPLFHYLTVQRNPTGLQVTSYKINSDFNSFETGLSFDIKSTSEVMYTSGHNRDNKGFIPTSVISNN